MGNYTVTLGQYKGMKRPVLSNEPEEKEIELYLKQQQVLKSTVEEVDTPAEEGSTIILDFKGFRNDVAFDGGTSENYELVLGSGTFIPGFEEQLIGVCAGESRDVVVTFPEKYPQPDLAGQEAVFKCTVKKVQNRILPEINDDLAKQFGLETVEDMRSAARDAIMEQMGEELKKEAQSRVMEQIMETSTVELSDAFLQQTINDVLDVIKEEIKQQGMQYDQYLQLTGLTEEQLLDQIRPQAENGAKGNAILEEIARAEGIVVTEEELDEELAKIGAMYGKSGAEVREVLDAESLVNVRDGLLSEKTMNFVMDCTVE